MLSLERCLTQSQYKLNKLFSSNNLYFRDSKEVLLFKSFWEARLSSNNRAKAINLSKTPYVGFSKTSLTHTKILVPSTF